MPGPSAPPPLPDSASLVRDVAAFLALIVFGVGLCVGADALSLISSWS